MAFSGGGWTINFRAELLQGIHNFNPDPTGDTFMVALYTNQATLDSLTTTKYTTAGEVVDATYVPGGNEAVSLGVFQPGQTSSGPDLPQMAYVTFKPVVWPLPTFTVRGALLYNASKANAAIAIADFGFDIVKDGTSDFTINFEQSDPAKMPVQVR